jgi:hypothetical protein
MGQRLVLKSKNKEVLLSDLRAFLNMVEEFKLPPSTVFPVARDIVLSVDLPKDQRIVNGRKVRVKGKTKKAVKVAEQITEHKESEQKQGYVPPVGRKTAPKGVKRKCPVCNVNKPVVTIGGVKVVKPHVVKGEPCAGSGNTPVGVSRKGK